jgi:hypothetical protein
MTTTIATYNETHKTCSKCNQTLLMEEFSNASGGKYKRSECKHCEKELNKIRKFLKETAPPVPKDYKCPICNRSEQEVKDKGGKKSGAWCLDHNHKTNTFRGWLCHQCNRALGGMNDDISRLKAAIKYLRET